MDPELHLLPDLLALLCVPCSHFSSTHWQKHNTTNSIVIIVTRILFKAATTYTSNKIGLSAYSRRPQRDGALRVTEVKPRLWVALLRVISAALHTRFLPKLGAQPQQYTAIHECHAKQNDDNSALHMHTSWK